jgi:hypothetical protein
MSSGKFKDTSLTSGELRIKLKLPCPRRLLIEEMIDLALSLLKTNGKSLPSEKRMVSRKRASLVLKLFALAIGRLRLCPHHTYPVERAQGNTPSTGHTWYHPTQALQDRRTGDPLYTPDQTFPT